MQKALDLCHKGPVHFGGVNASISHLQSAKDGGLGPANTVGVGVAMLQDEKPKTYDKHVGVSKNRGTPKWMVYNL